MTGKLARRGSRADARRQFHEKQAYEFTEEESSADSLLRLELQRDLADCVASLREPYRGVLLQYHYEGLSVREISHRTGRPLGTIRAQLSRGLELVRASFTARHGEARAPGLLLLAAGPPLEPSPWIRDLLLMKASTKTALAVSVAFTLAFIAVKPLVLRQGSNYLERGHVTVESPRQPRLEVLGAAERNRERTGQPQLSDVPSDEVEGVGQTLPQRASRIHARILGPHGEPKVGASLRAIEMDGRGRGERSVAFADHHGRVVLSLEREQMRTWRGQALEMTFAASAEGQATHFVTELPVLYGDTDLGDLYLDPGAAIAGRCVDEKGLPVAGATILVGPQPSAGEWDSQRISGPLTPGAKLRTHSDPEGWFELSGLAGRSGNEPAGSRGVWIHRLGSYWSIIKVPHPRPGERIDLGVVVLEPVPREERIEGRVLDPSGQAVPGVEVHYLSHQTPQSGQVESDEDGRFLIVPRMGAALSLLAQDPRGRWGLSATHSAQAGDKVQLWLGPKRAMNVQVLDAQQRPVQEASVRLLAVEDIHADLEQGALLPGGRWSDTDDAGQVTLSVPRQPFAVWVRMDGYGSQRSGPFAPHAVPELVTVTLPTTRMVRGRVLAYGKPLAGARVALGEIDPVVVQVDGFPTKYRSGASSFVRTDMEGNFEIAVGTGKGPIVAHADGYASADCPLVFQDPTNQEVQLSLTRGGVIEGRLLPPMGARASEYYVAASRGDGQPFSTRVDGEGYFRLSGLTPGDWRVEGRERPVRRDLVFVAETPEERTFRWDVRVGDGQTVRYDVDLRGGGVSTLDGRLSIDGASPSAGWTVQLHPLQEQAWFRDPLATDLDWEGRFRLQAAPGRWRMLLAGELSGGEYVEIFRELILQEEHLEWSEDLETAPFATFLDAIPERVRWVRGSGSDREQTYLDVGPTGALRGRGPVGPSALQALSREEGSEEPVWRTLEQALIE